MNKPTKFKVEVSIFNPEVFVLRIHGFIDVNAAPAFERELENLIRNERTRILVDLSRVTYISSAGIGVFVGYLKDARSRPGGDIKICGADAKLKKVFAAIGLTSMMDFLEAEASVGVWNNPQVEASRLKRFVFQVVGSEVLCGREFQLRVAALDAEGRRLPDYRGVPKLIISSGLVLPRELSGFKDGLWEGKAVVTESGILALIVVDEQAEGRMNLLVQMESGRAEFPCTVSCRHCATTARVKGMNIYRCARCNEIFYVDAWAHVIALKPGNLKWRGRVAGKRMSLKINTDINYLNSVRRFIQGLCEQEKLSEEDINAVSLTVEEALLNLIEHSVNFEPNHEVEVKLWFQKSRLQIRIRDFGEPFDITQYAGTSIAACIQKGMKGGVGGMLIHQLMDSVAYRRYSHYNDLILVKGFPRRKPAAGATNA